MLSSVMLNCLEILETAWVEIILWLFVEPPVSRGFCLSSKIGQGGALNTFYQAMSSSWTLEASIPSLSCILPSGIGCPRDLYSFHPRRVPQFFKNGYAPKPGVKVVTAPLADFFHVLCVSSRGTCTFLFNCFPFLKLCKPRRVIL